MERWRTALAVYKDPRMLRILLLGFSSGLPLLLTLSTLSTWLATLGVGLTTIGLFALVGLPYSFKFVWSPVMDGVRLPVLGPLLGQRRSWAVVTQIALMGSMLFLGLTDPAHDPLLTALAALLVAFCSASQDIVIDAYRVEILQTKEQGAGAAAIQIGYRLGMLAAGAGALFIADHLGWFAAFVVMAGLVSIGLATILLSPEPSRPVSDIGPVRPGAPAAERLTRWMRAHVIEPFADFSRRQGWIVILLFILLYKFGDAVAGVMANPFYIEMGFSLTEIASVSKIFGLLATLAGAVAGGVVCVRYGLFKGLLACGVLQMLSNLMFAGAGQRRLRCRAADRNDRHRELLGRYGLGCLRRLSLKPVQRRLYGDPVRAVLVLYCLGPDHVVLVRRLVGRESRLGGLLRGDHGACRTGSHPPSLARPDIRDECGVRTGSSDRDKRGCGRFQEFRLTLSRACVEFPARSHVCPGRVRGRYGKPQDRSGEM